MPTHDRLTALSHHRERRAARRLALRTGQTPEQALRQTMAAAAGEATLMQLVLEREDSAARIAAALASRRSDKAAQRAARLAAAQPDPDAWLAWFDGSCHPNPGKLGIGGMLRSPAGETVEICRMAGHGDSNEAEFLALIAILEAAIDAGVNRLVVYGDSQVVIGAVRPSDPQALPATHWRGYSEQARALAARIENLTLTWIPRHKNNAADTLSQRAIALFPAALA
jgi:ribonuclease HI